MFFRSGDQGIRLPDHKILIAVNASKTMELRILENPDLKNTAEDIFGSANHGTQVLYIILLSLLFITGGLMAVIQVPVYVESRGTLRPCSDRKVVCSPAQGIVGKIFVEENQIVRKNDLILIINTDKEKVQLGFLNQEIKNTSEWLYDCNYLTINHPSVFDSLRTAKYRAEFLLFEQEQQLLEIEIKQLTTDINRLKPMEKDSLISKKEMEEIEIKYFNLVGRLKSNLSLKVNQWQIQADNFKQKYASLSEEKFALEYFINEAEIRAPESGSIQGIRNIFAGDFCSPGKPLCTLVPDTGMVVEMFIDSRDIGYIKPGMRTRFKIDAFDYKYWGFLEGRCVSISNDFEMVDNLPFFRVICQPDLPCKLSYGNKTVDLSPGMTLTSQFIFTSRSIWQLIRDKIYDWVEED